MRHLAVLFRSFLLSHPPSTSSCSPSSTHKHKKVTSFSKTARFVYKQKKSNVNWASLSKSDDKKDMVQEIIDEVIETFGG